MYYITSTYTSWLEEHMKIKHLKQNKSITPRRPQTISEYPFTPLIYEPAHIDPSTIKSYKYTHFEGGLEGGESNTFS